MKQQLLKQEDPRLHVKGAVVFFVLLFLWGVCVCGVTECPVTIFSISQQGDQASSD